MADRTDGIEVVDRYARTPLDRGVAIRAARAARAFARREHLAVSLLLTDDEEIARLHGSHLDDSSATDVMSFPVDDGVEVVVSVECAERRARELGGEPADELALYVVHGVLHACGFDDRAADERARMRDAERAVLEGLGIRIARFE